MRKNAKDTSPKPSQGDLENVWPPPPPAEETELEHALRLQEESKAARCSAEIDQAIERSRVEAQKRRRQIRILLLGEHNRFCFLLYQRNDASCYQDRPSLVNPPY
jgi:hypothetical protein